MITASERTPSRNGIGSGLHIGHRPVQPNEPSHSTEINQTDSINTQRPNNPAPSHRGYA